MNKDSKLIYEAYRIGYDIAEDYADRIMGAGVTDPMHLAGYYYSNPEEIPEPMKADIFLSNFKNIISHLKKKAHYHTVENEELKTVESFPDHVAKNLPAGLSSDAAIHRAAKHYIAHKRGDADAIIVARDKSISNKILSSYRKMHPNPSEEAEQEQEEFNVHTWHTKTLARYKAMNNDELLEELKDNYTTLFTSEFGSYSHDSAKLEVEIIEDELEKRGFTHKQLSKIWDEIESKYDK